MQARYLAFRSFPAWVGPTFGLLAAGLALWTAGLAAMLPSHHAAANWRLAWVGFDLLLVFGLARTAWLARRRSPLALMPATATAALLFADAWFDVTTAGAGRDRALALVTAFGAEIPLALVCLLLARRALRHLGAR